jgi:selenoprotein W-related protein
MPVSPMIEITYCRLCGWGLRAGWMAQELLTTFAEELGSVTLTPDRTGGVFEVRIDDEVIWSRKERGRFPEIKEVKQLVRDRVAPGRSLGHTVTGIHAKEITGLQTPRLGKGRTPWIIRQARASAVRRSSRRSPAGSFLSSESVT